MSKKEPLRKKCINCQERKHGEREFYMSNSKNHSDSRYPVCKKCIRENFAVEEDFLSESSIKKIQDILIEMNRPYIHDVWLSSVEESKNRNVEIIGTLMKNLNLNHKTKDWRDSEFTSASEKKIQRENAINNVSEKVSSKNEVEIELDTQNEKDVLRLLGYDPFDYEAESDRANLFNKLIDYLDESTLEDGFKLTSVIEIVRTFNQLDKINAAISRAFDVDAKDTKGVTALVNAKDKMMKTALEIAKENEVSMKHATDKGQGAGTFSGMLKNLLDNDILEAETNLFDIETSKGIKQVADISHQSIMSQLNFDENDTAEMLKEQRVLIKESREKAHKLEEENRKLKIEIKEKNREITKLKTAK